MKLIVKTLDNKDAGELVLEDAVFAIEPSVHLLNMAVRYQLHKRRSGNHKTKDRGEVSGTNSRPWRQKGTGRARAGSLKRPQDVGGATVFGPVVRSHAISLPKKVRALALRMALSSRALSNKLLVLDNDSVSSYKTKEMSAKLNALGIHSAFIVSGQQVNETFFKAVRNIPLIDVVNVNGANVYDILKKEYLVLTKDAVSALTERLK
jgi:large subunit ribosomal protein L4